MKINKIISLLLCVCICLCTAFALPGFAAETKAAEDYGKSAYDFLKAVGALDSEELDYKADTPVSRAWFVKLALHLSNDAPKVLVSDDEVFYDVTPDTDYEAYIETAYRIGYISGSAGGNFDPDSTVTLPQALKILANILGYNEIASARGGYPGGYYMVAQSLDLTDGLELEAEGALSMKDAMLLLYNAANTDLMEIESYGDPSEYKSYDGKTILTERHKVDYVEGIITATAYTDLITQETSLDKNQIAVDDMIFDSSSYDAAEYLGCEVKLYYDTESSKTAPKVLYAELTENNHIISYNPEQLFYTDSGVEYEDESGKTEKLKLSPKASYIVNGKFAAMSPKDLPGVNGFVRLISNDGDKTADVVAVTDYDVYIVSGASSINNVIVANDGSKIYLDPDDDSYTFSITDSNGYASSISQIKPDTVILMAESKGSGLIKKELLISNNSIAGTVNEKGDDYIVIAGNRYEMNADAYSKTEIGRYYIFLLDSFGKIVHASVENYVVYGYLYGIKERTGLGGGVYCRIFTENNRWVELDLKDKIRFNGELINSEEILTDKYLGSDIEAQRRMIRYNTNPDAEVVLIETSIDVPLGADDEFEAIENGTFRKSFSGSAYWRRTPRSFNGNFFLDTDAKVFVIPTDNATDKFKVYGFDDLRNNTTYSLTAYDVDEYLSTKIITVSEIAKGVSIDDKFMIVKSIGQILNSEGEAVPSLKGWWGGSEVSFPVDTVNGYVTNEQLSYLKTGDVLQITYDETGTVTNIQKHGGENSDYYLFNPLYDICTVAGGRVIRCDSVNNHIRLEYEAGTLCGITFSATTPVYVYDTEKETFTMASVSEIARDDKIIAKLNYLTANEIVVIR